MNVMSALSVEPADLLDLKFLPAWVKEPGATNHYDHYTAEEAPTELRIPDTRMEHFAPANGGDKLDTRRPSRRGATAAERRRQKAPGVAIPIEAEIVVRRIGFRSPRQSRSRGRFISSRVRTYSKMWLLRLTPARLPIRSLF
jgi:hypothetical protein